MSVLLGSDSQVQMGVGQWTGRSKNSLGFLLCLLGYPLSVWDRPCHGPRLSALSRTVSHCFAEIALDPCLGGAFTCLALTTRFLGQLPIGRSHLRVVFLGTRWQTESEIGILVREIF